MKATKKGKKNSAKVTFIAKSKSAAIKKRGTVTPVKGVHKYSLFAISTLSALHQIAFFSTDHCVVLVILQITVRQLMLCIYSAVVSATKPKEPSSEEDVDSESTTDDDVDVEGDGSDVDGSEIAETRNWSKFNHLFPKKKNRDKNLLNNQILSLTKMCFGNTGGKGAPSQNMHASADFVKEVDKTWLKHLLSRPDGHYTIQVITMQCLPPLLSTTAYTCHCAVVIQEFGLQEGEAPASELQFALS